MHRVKLRFDGILGRRPVAISNHSSPCRTQLGKELVVIPKEERAQRLSVRLDAPHRGFRLILFFFVRVADQPAAAVRILYAI